MTTSVADALARELMAHDGEDGLVALSIELAKCPCPVIQAAAERTATAVDKGLFGIGFGKVSRSKMVITETKLIVPSSRATDGAVFDSEKAVELERMEIPLDSIVGIASSYFEHWLWKKGFPNV